MENKESVCPEGCDEGLPLGFDGKVAHRQNGSMQGAASAWDEPGL